MQRNVRYLGWKTLGAYISAFIFNVALDFGGRVLKEAMEVSLALMAFVAVLFKVNTVLIVLAALGLGALFIRPTASSREPLVRSLPVSRPLSPGR